MAKEIQYTCMQNYEWLTNSSVRQLYLAAIAYSWFGGKDKCECTIDQELAGATA